jgi:hypothetical protein
MGFSLMFMRVDRTAVVDADREAVRAFLEARRLTLVPGKEVDQFADAHGPLRFDGHTTDLHLDSLESEEPLTGGIWHASMSAEELEFIYELCVAGRMLIVNPQGSPLFLVPAGNHASEQLPDGVDQDSDVVWVNSAAELSDMLSGGASRFFEYKNRVIGLTNDD